MCGQAGIILGQKRRRAEERGWCELSIPPMSLMVFRHRMLRDFSIEPFEFVAQARRRKTAPAEEAP